MSGLAARPSARLPKRKPKPRPRRLPNNALRRIKSPNPPANVEMQYVTALRRANLRFARAIRSVFTPEVITRFARPETERADAIVLDAVLDANVYAWLEHFDAPKKKEKDDETDRARSKQVAAQMEKARKEVEASRNERELHAATKTASERTLLHSKREFKRLGLDVRKEPTLTALMSGWRHDNVALITRMQDDELAAIEEILEEGYGRRAENIAEDIEGRLGISSRRAELIARDQVLTLNAKITRYRQTACGIRSYVWTTSKDERVRPEHVELEGVTFSWDGEGDPEEGHPGEAINCRCVAFPLLDDDFLGEDNDGANDVEAAEDGEEDGEE